MLLLFCLLLVCLLLIVFGFFPLNENLVSLKKKKKQMSIENVFSLISFSSGSTTVLKIEPRAKSFFFQNSWFNPVFPNFWLVFTDLGVFTEPVGLADLVRFLKQWVQHSWKKVKKELRQNKLGKGLCPMKVITGHIRIRTCVQEWTRVRNLMCPVITFTESLDTSLTNKLILEILEI